MGFIGKTLGGLSAAYYFRHFIFGAAISGLYFYIVNQAPTGINTGLAIFLLVNMLLYPYSRFVYEQIISFIMGDNVFFINAIIMLVVKFITMVLCWSFSIFVAPIGLAYLYFYHTKAEKNANPE